MIHDAYNKIGGWFSAPGKLCSKTNKIFRMTGSEKMGCSGYGWRITLKLDRRPHEVTMGRCDWSEFPHGEFKMTNLIGVFTNGVMITKHTTLHK